MKCEICGETNPMVKEPKKNKDFIYFDDLELDSLNKYFGRKERCVEKYTEEDVYEYLWFKNRDKRISDLYPINSRVDFEIIDGRYRCKVCGIDELNYTVDLELDGEIFPSIPLHYINKSYYKYCHFKNKNPLINWECDVCTYINQGDSTTCKVCCSKRLNNDYNNNIDLDSLTVGSIIDCKDRRGKWYPSKVIGRNKNKITIHFRGWSDDFDEEIDINDSCDKISKYKSKKEIYGLHIYTIQYFYIKLVNIYLKSKQHDKLHVLYPIKSKVYLTVVDDVYECEVLGVDEEQGTVDLLYNEDELMDIPMSYVSKKVNCCSVHRGKKDMRRLYRVVMNISRRPVRCSLSIDYITNSFISDLNKSTVYKNDMSGV